MRRTGKTTRRLLTSAVAAAALSLGACTIVPAGHVGVQSMFGDVREEEFEPGMHVKNPFLSVHDMSTRETEVFESMNVPTQQGLEATLEVSIIYHLDGTRADDVFDNLGTQEDYEANIIRPNLRSVTRDVVSQYDAEALYSAGRATVESDMEEGLKAALETRGFVLDQVLIRDLELPIKLREAIESKLSQEQASLEMDYTLDIEAKESERKLIEAQGIAAAQAEIAESLSDEYLSWYFIQTQQQLVNSPNNTTVILPYDTGLIPMMDVAKPGGN